jgi:hypothetical protein
MYLTDKSRCSVRNQLIDLTAARSADRSADTKVSEIPLR